MANSNIFTWKSICAKWHTHPHTHTCMRHTNRIDVNRNWSQVFRQWETRCSIFPPTQITTDFYCTLRKLDFYWDIVAIWQQLHLGVHIKSIASFSITCESNYLSFSAWRWQGHRFQVKVRLYFNISIPLKTSSYCNFGIVKAIWSFRSAMVFHYSIWKRFYNICPNSM